MRLEEEDGIRDRGDEKRKEKDDKEEKGVRKG